MKHPQNPELIVRNKPRELKQIDGLLPKRNHQRHDHEEKRKLAHEELAKS